VDFVAFWLRRREVRRIMNNHGKGRILLILGTIIILGVGAFFLLGGLNQKGSDQNFRKMKIERGDIRSVVTATGTINPVVTVLVGSQVSGTIKALNADFNSRVDVGQVIAQIDPAIFESQVEQARASVTSEQANLANAQANLLNIQANLVKAEVAVTDTKRTLDRNLQLMKMSAVAQAVLDTAQANYDSAVAQREASKAQLEVSKAQIESAKAQVERSKAALKMAETNLRYTTIRSPVNGIVISRNVDVGQTVAASLQAPTLFTIAKDLTQMQVDTNFSEADIGRIQKGQEATFTVDAYPERPFQGRVFEIRNAPQTIQNVVTYDVVIQVDNKELRLKPGMTANVTIVVAHREGVLKIPNAALRYTPQDAKMMVAAVSKKGDDPSKSETADSSARGGASRPRTGREADSSRSTGRSGGASRFTEGLNLTAEQQEKAEMIISASRPEIQEIRQKSKPEEATVKIQALIREKLKGILTEDQKRKLEESSASTQVERKSGRIWIVSADGKAVPVSVIIGITDGTFSEIISGDLREGTDVIVGESGKNNQANRGTPSPFGGGPGGMRK
jgi:HlyD family secretion protein